MRRDVLSYLFMVGLIASHTCVWSREIKGLVRSGDLNLSGVVVTDGNQFTKTNQQGEYVLDVVDSSKFVYIFTPSGFTGSLKTGVPQFYKELNDSTFTCDFNLDKLPYDSDKYAIVAIADPQTKTIEQFTRFKRESIEDIKGTILENQTTQRNTIGIALGDIAWDELEMFNNYKQAIAELGIPFYPVIGNHDHDLRYNDDRESEKTYSHQFGPTYYGFNIGRQYVLVLDDIVYKGKKKYEEDLTEEELAWVESYLDYVPKGSELIIAMHAPLKIIQKYEILPHGQRLIDICKDYQLSILSGHTHLNSNTEVSKGVIEHNIGAVCGSWWTAETCRDGTPNGYLVLEGDQTQVSWYYKATGKERQVQMELYDRGEAMHHPNAVVAKIWNWDSKWQVRWLEDGKPKGEMQQITSYDPGYLRYVKAHNTKTNTINYDICNESFFYFAANPSLKAKKIEVVVTDRFGKEYHQEIELESVEVQAHRGGAGLMPENSIPGMLNAVASGVNTLEMDLQLTKDGQVVVAHDHYVNSGFTLGEDGQPLTGEANKLLIYGMDYDDVKKYDIGSKEYLKFPNQKKIKVHVPLLSDLIDSVELFVNNNHYGSINYNIEIKSNEKLESKKEIADYKTQVDRAMCVLKTKQIEGRLVIQSFDYRVLNYVHEKYQGVRLGYLVSTDDNIKMSMKQLKFMPDIFSPNYQQIDEELIRWCHDNGMQIVPWTVDQESDIKDLLKWHVDGIISNYPDRVLNCTRGY